MTMLEFIQAGGQVTLLGQPLEERLSPRQMRYLFAIGAFGRGKVGAGTRLDKKISASNRVGVATTPLRLARTTPGMQQAMAKRQKEKRGLQSLARLASKKFGGSRGRFMVAARKQADDYGTSPQAVFRGMLYKK